MTLSSVIIGAEDLKRLENCALEALPNEGCALLLGRRTSTHQAYYIDAVKIGENLSVFDKKISFEIDPAILFEAQRQARAGGPEIIGIWHSHPLGKPAPSKTDKARSLERDWVWLISGFVGEEVITKGYMSGSEDPTHFTDMIVDIAP